MTANRVATVRYDTGAIALDMTRKGWSPAELARKAGKSRMTIARFLAGEYQTAKTAKAIADGLGYPIERYLISVETVAATDAQAQAVTA